jgi:hypothetical protein
MPVPPNMDRDFEVRVGATVFGEIMYLGMPHGRFVEFLQSASSNLELQENTQSRSEKTIIDLSQSVLFSQQIQSNYKPVKGGIPEFDDRRRMGGNYGAKLGRLQNGRSFVRY